MICEDVGVEASGLFQGFLIRTLEIAVRQGNLRYDGEVQHIVVLWPHAAMFPVKNNK